MHEQHKQQDVKEPRGTRSYTGSSLSLPQWRFWLLTLQLPHGETATQLLVVTRFLCSFCLCFPPHHGAVSAPHQALPCSCCWQDVLRCPGQSETFCRNHPTRERKGAENMLKCLKIAFLQQTMSKHTQKVRLRMFIRIYLRKSPRYSFEPETF